MCRQIFSHMRSLDVIWHPEFSILVKWQHEVIINRRRLQKITKKVFDTPNATKKDDIASAGVTAMKSLYGESRDISIDEHNLQKIKTKVASMSLITQIEASSLPLTTAACYQHSMRVFLKVQTCHASHKLKLQACHSQRQLAISTTCVFFCRFKHGWLFIPSYLFQLTGDGSLKMTKCFGRSSWTSQ